MTKTSLLEKYINNSGYKRGYIAEQIGISRFSLAQKINNKSEFKANEIKTLCTLLGIDSEARSVIFFAE